MSSSIVIILSRIPHFLSCSFENDLMQNKTPFYELNPAFSDQKSLFLQISVFLGIKIH